MTIKQGTHESGRSMIEMLGVLAIIGVLSVGGIAGYSQAMSKFKVSKTTDQVQTMVTNIRTLFTGQRTYNGLDGKNAYTMGILTDETWDSTTSAASNAYGGSILFGTPNNKKYFSITYNGLSQDACTRLVMADWGDSSSGLIAIIAQSTAQTAPADATTAWTAAEGKSGKGTFLTSSKTEATGIPVILTSAVGACANGVDNAASVTWIYR